MNHALVLPLAIVLSGCCLPCGGSDAAPPQRQRLDPYGISIETSRGATGGATPTGYAWTSSDGSSFTYVMPASAGPPAAQRDAQTMVPGVSSVRVQWSRPVMIGGMSALEARVIEDAPQQRVHWIATVDAPSGPLLIQLVTDQRWVTSDTFGDIAWERLKGSVQRVQ